MTQESKIITQTASVWKPKGQSMGELVTTFRQSRPELAEESITYAGRLDPMAEGVVILLWGDAVHRKEEFLALSKEYEFTCLWGIETDTYDALGLIQRVSDMPQSEEVTTAVRDSSIIKEQEYPPYSSKTVQGKPLFMWAREGRLGEIAMPRRPVSIDSLHIVDEEYIRSADLLHRVESSIVNVKGDFRQEEILSSWRENLTDERVFLMTTMKAVVSSGTYVRALAHSIGQSLGVGGIALSITRTKVGLIGREMISLG